MRLPNGKIARKTANDKLGKVSQMTEAEARRKLTQVISAVDHTPPKDHMTIEEFYLGKFKPEHIDKQAKHTQNFSGTIFNQHILPAIGDNQVQNVTLSMCQQLCDLVADSGRLNTSKRVKFTLTAMFNRAIAHGLIERNPATAVLLKRMEPKPLWAPTMGQVQALLPVLAGLRDDDDFTVQRVRVMVLLACSTSTNYAEMAGIPWRRVNLTDKLVIMEGQNLPAHTVAIWSNNSRGVEGPTKTKTRHRVLPLTTDLEMELKAPAERRAERPSFWDRDQANRLRRVAATVKRGRPAGGYRAG
jgi:hypothetical protein